VGIGPPPVAFRFPQRRPTKLADSYHELWRRPFPPGLEMGQILLSAVFERPMRDYLDALSIYATTNSSLGGCVYRQSIENPDHQRP
jgi:hypothetical protein